MSATCDGEDLGLAEAVCSQRGEGMDAAVGRAVWQQRKPKIVAGHGGVEGVPLTWAQRWSGNRRRRPGRPRARRRPGPARSRWARPSLAVHSRRDAPIASTFAEARRRTPSGALAHAGSQSFAAGERRVPSAPLQATLPLELGAEPGGARLLAGSSWARARGDPGHGGLRGIVGVEEAGAIDREAAELDLEQHRRGLRAMGSRPGSPGVLPAVNLPAGTSTRAPASRRAAPPRAPRRVSPTAPRSPAASSTLALRRQGHRGARVAGRWIRALGPVPAGGDERAPE